MLQFYLFLLILLAFVFTCLRIIFIAWRGNRRYKHMIEEWRRGGYPN